MNLSVSYFVMVVGILLAKCLGFVRESTVANNFGVSALTDIYFQVYSVANVIFAAVGVSLSLLAVKSLNENKCENEWAFVKIFIKKVLKYAAFGLLGMAVFGYPIVKMLFIGISRENFYIALKLYYIMLPTLIFIMLAYTLNGVLQNKGKFFITAILSVPFNVIIIGSMLLGTKNIYAFGLVTTIGWASQFLFLLPSFFKNVKDTGIEIKNQKEIFKNINMQEIAFIFVSNLVFQLLFVVDKAFVGGNGGTSSAIHYSSYLFTTVCGIFLAGMAAVFFPTLTKSISENNEKQTKSIISYVLVFMFIIFVAFLMIAGFYNENIISLLYERGSFTKNDTYVVSKYFLIYSFCIFGYITQELIFKIFYAKSRYKLTVISAISVTALNIICNFIFRKNPFMIAVSTALISSAFAIFMFVFLARMYRGVFDRKFILNTLKIILSALVYPLVYLIFKDYISLNKIIFAVPVLISSVIYFGLLWSLGPLKLVKK